MSDGNRRERSKTFGAIGAVSFAVAVGALYCWMFYDMGASASRYSVEQEQAAQAYTENATREVYAECAARPDRLTCEREVQEARREGQRSEKDLEAQQGMSDWAFWLLVISAFQFPATLAALIFVKRTLDATLEAVEDTGRATKAMQESNDIAREGAAKTEAALKIAAGQLAVAQETADRELRPYVYISERIFDYDEFMAGMISDIGEAKFRIKNFGKTPAKKVTIRASAKIGGHWAEDPPATDIEPVEVQLGDLPPDDVTGADGYSVFGLNESQQFLRDGVMSVFVWGTIGYWDAGGEHFVTDFRFASTGPHFDDRRLTVCLEGNDAT